MLTLYFVIFSEGYIVFIVRTFMSDELLFSKYNQKVAKDGMIFNESEHLFILNVLPTSA